jgi:dUTP pyrophosphatase
MMLHILTENPSVAKYFTELHKDPLTLRELEDAGRAPAYPFRGDSGLNLIISKEIIVPADARGFAINHEVKCEMTDLMPTILTNFKPTYFPYYLYPRSSISNTPLRMSNTVGIIDSGYRGDIIAKVDNLSSSPYLIEAGKCLFQICASNLLPFEVKLVTRLSDSHRGQKGFGSTTA